MKPIRNIYGYSVIFMATRVIFIVTRVAFEISGKTFEVFKKHLRSRK